MAEIITTQTRGEIIQRAFDEIAVQAYVFDLSGDELASALRAFDNMLSSYAGEGIDLGYVPPADGAAMSDEMGTPAWADKPLALNLAVELAPSYGKTPSAETRRAARRGDALIRAKSLKTAVLRRPVNALVGAGDRRLY